MDTVESILKNKYPGISIIYVDCTNSLHIVNNHPSGVQHVDGTKITFETQTAPVFSIEAELDINKIIKDNEESQKFDSLGDFLKKRTNILSTALAYNIDNILKFNNEIDTIEIGYRKESPDSVRFDLGVIDSLFYTDEGTVKGMYSVIGYKNDS